MHYNQLLIEKEAHNVIDRVTVNQKQRFIVCSLFELFISGSVVVLFLTDKTRTTAPGGDKFQPSTNLMTTVNAANSLQVHELYKDCGCKTPHIIKNHLKPLIEE